LYVGLDGGFWATSIRSGLMPPFCDDNSGAYFVWLLADLTANTL